VTLSPSFEFAKCPAKAAAFIIANVIVLQSAVAAPIPAKIVVLPLRPSAWIRSGAAIGGQAAADELSLLRVRRAARPDGGERLLVAYGDKYGRPLRAQPGYFHLALDRGGRRLSLDLAQVSRTAVDRRDLEKLFANSTLVASVDIVMDPQDGSTHLSLAFAAPIEAFASTASGDASAPAGLAFDFRPVAGPRPAGEKATLP
jgi:hypothetical protein